MLSKSFSGRKPIANSAVLLSFLMIIQTSSAATLHELIIENRNVFNQQLAEKNGIARLLNKLNWTTKPELVEREFWLQPGDTIEQADAIEFQRKLRAMDIFSSVDVQLITSSEDPEKSNLQIITQDRSTIRIGASSEYVGGVTEVGFRASELNFLGLGDIVSFSFEEDSANDSRQAFSYLDKHLGDSILEQSIQLGETQDGEFSAYRLLRPFEHLHDKRAWQLELKNADEANDYYEADTEIASLAYQDQNLIWSNYWRVPKENKKNIITHGFITRYDNWQYGELSGASIENIETPEDFKRFFLGYYFSVENQAIFETLTGLDTLIFPQDIALSNRHEFVMGLSRREDLETSYQPELLYEFRTGRRTCLGCYLSSKLNTSVRLLEDEIQQSQISLTMNGYWLGAERHKLAARIMYDNNYVIDSFPIASFIGEDTGLRGYANNTDSGTKRLLVNLEDRILTEWEYATIRLGLIGFYDIAWVADRGESFSDPYRSVGLGLRFGSKQLFGSNVVRIDLSYPLDGDDASPLLSIAAGQLFTF